MEYASGGDMFEHVVRKGGLKENEARWFFQQLIVGVDYVHKMVRLLDSHPTNLQAKCPPGPVACVTACCYCDATHRVPIAVQGVANRDIKLENTLLDGSPRPLVKICDFGYSKVCKPTPASHPAAVLTYKQSHHMLSCSSHDLSSAPS